MIFLTYSKSLSILMLISVYVILSIFPSQAQETTSDLKPVTVITGEWAPYTTESESNYGYMSELVTQTLRGMDRKVNYQFLPFFAGYEKTKNGGAFATFPYFYSKERSKDFFYSAPLTEIEYVVFIHSSNAEKFSNVKQLSDLKAFSMAKVAGYAYGKLDEYIKPSGKDLASEIQAFRQLLSKKADYVAASRAVGMNIIERYFFKDLHQFQILKIKKNTDSSLPIDLSWNINVHVLFPKVNSNAESDRDGFNASLKKIQETGIQQSMKTLNTRDVKARRIVKLSDPGSFALVTAKKSLQSDKSYIIPRGSKALVVEWSRNFKVGLKTTVHQQMNQYTKVRLLNGPLRGHIVYVRNMFIELPDE